MIAKMMAWFMLFVSCFYLYFARELSFGSFAAPKAGFLPIIAGILAIVLSITNIIWQRVEKPEKPALFLERKFLFIIVGLFSYLVMMRLFGNLFATTVMMFYFLKVNNTPGWIKPTLISVFCAAGFYAIFELYLGTHLP